MLMYRWWFENQMKMQPETETLNLSPGGLAIEGMPPVPLEHLTGRPPLPEDTRANEALRAPRIHDIPSGVRALAGAVTSLVGELSQLEAMAEEGVRLTNALRQDLHAGRYVALHRLDAVDTRIRSVPHRDIAGFLIQNTLSDVARDATESWTTERLLRRSQEIYRGLLDSVTYHRRLLQSAVTHGDNR
jgi:PAS domain-containing protein